MHVSKLLIPSAIAFAGVSLSGCGSSSGQPSTLKEQQAAMHTAAPDPDALKNAMSKVHFNKPGDNAQKPPDGQAVPGAGK